VLGEVVDHAPTIFLRLSRLTAAASQRDEHIHANLHLNLLDHRRHRAIVRLEHDGRLGVRGDRAGNDEQCRETNTQHDHSRNSIKVRRIRAM
jgi:hypothetical protein